MADSVQYQVTTPSFKTTGSGSPSMFQEISNLGAPRVAQLEALGFEMARTGRSFNGGISVIAGGISPVSDLPTTTGPIILFNSAPQTGTTRVLVVKRLGFAYASGTLSAFGSSLFAGVTPSKLATALTANGSNIRTQAARGTATPYGLIDVGKTITQPTWMQLGGIAHGAEATMSLGFSLDLTGHPFIVPPQFSLAWGVLSALDGAGATTPLYLASVSWDEIEAVLP